MHISNLYEPFVIQKDDAYKSQLQVPDSGLTLKTRIFVSVKATNLTQRYYTWHLSSS